MKKKLMGSEFDGGSAYPFQQWELMFSSFQHSDVGMEMGINMTVKLRHSCLHRRYTRWRSLPWNPGGAPLSSTVQINAQKKTKTGENGSCSKTECECVTLKQGGNASIPPCQLSL